VNYLAANSFTDLDMTFQNIELTTFSPYSGKFAGYRIDRGKLSLDMNYHIADRRLEARHHVVISQLELGDRVASPEAVSIPVKLAVALLKDREGVIDLELPVTGSVDDPTFALGDVLWTVFRNLLVKAVTSPFALLGSLAGAGEGGELEFVEFAPGSAVLDPADLEKLGKLGQALAARPALQLDIPLVQTAEDAQVLADRPGELANLAKARADVVQQALIDDAGIDPGRIFVVNTVTETANPPPGGAPDRVRAQLLLH
jgi:outer membrane protein OmpA-like peptidoglycan-associated protein